MKYVYLHGFASSPASKKAQFFRERFAAAGVALEIPDLNPRPEAGGFEMLTVTGLLAAAEPVIGPGPAIVIGSSLGGYLAALCAARNPGIEGVVLLAPAFAFSRRWEQRLGPAGFAEWESRGYLDVFHYGGQVQARVRFDLMRDARRYDDFPDVRQRVLIFHGRNDDVVPVELSREFVRRHPHAELHEMDSGHELTDCLEYLWEHTSRFCLPRSR